MSGLVGWGRLMAMATDEMRADAVFPPGFTFELHQLRGKTMGMTEQARRQLEGRSDEDVTLDVEIEEAEQARAETNRTLFELGRTVHDLSRCVDTIDADTDRLERLVGRVFQAGKAVERAIGKERGA